MTSSILITGASRGIGLALARCFTAAGWRVYAGCRSPETATELAAQAQRADGRLTVHPLDVGKSAQRAAMAAAVGPGLDVLVNNAGVWGQLPSEFGNTDADAWQRGFATNTIAPMLMMEAFADSLGASARPRIVNVTSRMGSIADNSSGGSYAYRASKAALNAITRSAAIDLGKRGIIVVCAHPGWVRTAMGGDAAPLDVAQSADGLFRLTERLGPADSGAFFNVDGTHLDW